VGSKLGQDLSEPGADRGPRAGSPRGVVVATVHRVNSGVATFRCFAVPDNHDS
jgi:hypothetical protein